MDEIEQLALFRRIAVSGMRGETNVQIPRKMLPALLLMAMADKFDEKWYLEQYPDVALAIKEGDIPSAYVHWANVGVFEGRLPRSVSLDENDYARRHKDVARAVHDGTTDSLTDHFVRIGFLEGREYQLEP